MSDNAVLRAGGDASMETMGRGMGIRGRLILAIGAVAMLTLVAGGFGVWSYARIQTSFQDVTDNSIPVMVNAFEMVDQSSSLTTNAAALAAAESTGRHLETRGRIETDRDEIQTLLDDMASSSLPTEHVESVQVQAKNLASSLADLDQMVGQRLALADERRKAVDEVETAHRALLTWLEPQIDNANAELVTRAEQTTGSLGDQIENLMTDGVGRLQAALVLRAEINQLASILIEAVILSDPGLIAEAEDRFIAVANVVEEQAALLGEFEGGEQLRAEIASLLAIGQSNDGIFAERRRSAGNDADSPEVEPIDSSDWTKIIFRPREAILLAIEPIVDEASFDLILLSESAVDDGAKTINQLIDQSVSSLRGYLGVAADANWLVGLLRQASSEPDAAALTILREQIDSAIGHLQDYRSIDSLEKEALAELDRLMPPIFEGALGERSILDARTREIDLARQQERKVAQVSQLAGALTNASTQLVDFARSHVEARSASVESAITRGRWMLAALSLTALCGAAAVIIFFVGPRIVDPMRSMANGVSRLAQGEQVAIQGLDRNDELGELARSLTVIHEKAIEASRIKLALDNADVSVLVVNAKGEIVYVNQRLLAMFKAAEADIRRETSDFQADGLLASTFDELSIQLGQPSGALERLGEAQKVEFLIGGHHFAYSANPVRGANDERLGAVVEWRDLTVELALQSAIDNVVAAAGAGDFSMRIETMGVSGAMGRLATGINQLTNVVEGATQDLGGMLGALATGNLSRRITADYQGTLGELKDHANRTADQLAEIVGQIQIATSEVKSAASEISTGTEDLSHRTEQAASSLEETAASTAEMAATVKRNAENARSASQLAKEADRSAKTGGQVVEQAVSAMGRIEDSAEKITDIISVIDEIAFQTNLLALNASVEAARAGEAGKGFAVVAQEVRQLAQRSAKAAADINELIQGSNSQVKDGVQLVNRAGEALADIVGSIGKVAPIIQEIDAASQDQAAGVQEISSSVTGMDEMTQQNSALVQESTAAARALDDQASRLAVLMDFFNFEGDNTFEEQKISQQARPRRLPHSAPAAEHEKPWSEF